MCCSSHRVASVSAEHDHLGDDAAASISLQVSESMSSVTMLRPMGSLQRVGRARL
jgi:hypothetical protein